MSVVSDAMDVCRTSAVSPSAQGMLFLSFPTLMMLTYAKAPSIQSDVDGLGIEVPTAHKTSNIVRLPIRKWML